MAIERAITRSVCRARRQAAHDLMGQVLSGFGRILPVRDQACGRHRAKPRRGGAACAAAATARLGQLDTDHPTFAALPARERLLAAAWLAGYHSARTRRAYALDLYAWLDRLQIHALAARRVHADLWARHLLDQGAAASSTGPPTLRAHQPIASLPRRRIRRMPPEGAAPATRQPHPGNDQFAAAGGGSVDRKARSTRGNVSAPIKPHLNPPIHYANARPPSRSAKIRTHTRGDAIALVKDVAAGLGADWMLRRMELSSTT